MGNNETIEIFMNDEIMEENVSVQIETNMNLENEREEEMKIKLKKLHAQKKSWQPHGILSFCWSFYCVNDNIEIDFENTQTMHCILCYQKHVIRINSKIQTRKGLISYYKTNGITIFLKTCGCRAHWYYKNVWRRSKKIYWKEENKDNQQRKYWLYLVGQFLFFFYQKRWCAT